MMLLGFAILLALVTGTIILLPLRVEVIYLKNENDDLLQVRLGISKFLSLFKLEVPVVKSDFNLTSLFLDFSTELKVRAGNKETKEQITIRKPIAIFIEAINLFLEKYAVFFWKLTPKLLQEYNRFLRKVRCQKLVWITEIGLNDPALTALTFGALWDLKFKIYRNLLKKVRVAFVKPDFKVIPDFQNKKLRLEFNCIFDFKAGHIITTGLRTSWIITRLLVRG